MPGRNGTGPTGQGPRTGWGRGNCTASQANRSQPAITRGNRPLGWGIRVWGTMVGWLFGYRRGPRLNRK
jgi:hypothetical protein